MKYRVMDKTNAVLFTEFLEYISDKEFMPEPRNAIVVLDNHTAHSSKKAKQLASDIGFTLFFLPPTASELNPIERMWSYFKTVWRNVISDGVTKISRDNIDDILLKCLEQVADRGTQLAKGPIREMVVQSRPYLRD